MILTHAHEDHVGALPYLLREVRVREVWATRLTLGLVNRSSTSTVYSALDRAARDRPGGAAARAGGRSGPSSCGCRTRCRTRSAIALERAAGRVFHTGDWKLDHTPVDGLRTDVGKLADLGNRGVDLMLGDSTNAERPGVTRSERVVGEAFRQMIPQRTGRVLISSFASNIHRMQQAIDVAVEVERKVAVVGRSMRKNLNIARNLGYVEAPDDLLVRPVELDDLPPEQAADPLHGLAGRAAVGADPDRVQRPPGRPGRARRHGDHLGAAGPGNELRVHDAINRLTRAGAEVLHQENAPVHVSGHRAPRSSARCSRSCGRRP